MSPPTDDSATTAVAEDAARLYLDLLRRCLTRSLFPEYHRPLDVSRRRRFLAPLVRLLEARNLHITRREPDSEVEARVREGTGWPRQAETMIGMRRLKHLEDCVRTVIQANIPGDLIETGVWRGGATILMRGALRAYGDNSRTVWVADSFRGLPAPRAEQYVADRDDPHWTFAELAVSLEDVKRNFNRYGLLDDQVQFLVGWFADTLPEAPIERLSLLRLDGDMYGSTMDALTALYPRVSPGGYVIIDDYGAIPACRQAVTDYRSQHRITEEIVKIDWTGVFWRRED